MNKFKKGDRVRVINVGEYENRHGIYSGFIGVVDEDCLYAPYVNFYLNGHNFRFAMCVDNLELVKAVATSADLDFRDHQTKPAELTDEQYEKIGEEIARIFRLIPHMTVEGDRWFLEGGYGTKTSAGLAKVFFRLAEEMRGGI